MNIEFVHKSAHQEYAAARSPKEIFFGERIRDVCEREVSAFVKDVDDHLFLSELEGEENFPAALLSVSVGVGVDDTFANRHADFVAVFIVETGFPGDSQCHFFGEVDAVEQRLKRDLNALRFCSHPDIRDESPESAISVS